GADRPRVARPRTERRGVGGHAAHRGSGAARRALSPGGFGAAGIRALFLAYFTWVGLFSPYLSLYLAAIGLTIAQIGMLMAVPQVLRIVGPPFWGWLADRGGSRVLLLRVSSVGAVLAALLLPLAGDRFAALMPVLALLFFMTAAQMPIGETIA